MNENLYNGSWKFGCYSDRSTDQGNSWLPSPKRVSDTVFSQTNGGAPLGRLVCDEHGKLHAAWMDSRSGVNAIFYSQSTDGGDTWLSPNIKVNNDTTLAIYPYLAVDHDGVYPAVIWDDVRRGVGQPRPFFARGERVSGMEEGNSRWSGSKLQGLRIQARGPLAGKLKAEFYLPHPGESRVAFYNVSGRKMGEYSLGFKGEGWHEIEMESDLPAGVYFVRLYAGDQSATGKMVVVR
jgi:hypothetical protein